MNKDLEYVMFTPEEIHQRVRELARELTEEYQGREPVLLCILKGSLVFTADLMREMDLPCTLESMTLSSYRAMATKPGELTMAEPPLRWTSPERTLLSLKIFSTPDGHCTLSWDFFGSRSLPP